MAGSSESTAIDRERRAVFVVVGCVGLLYAALALLRLARFDMTAFDAGIFDNVLWRLANGYDDVTAITGSHHFSDHLSPLLLAAVPLYAVLPGLALQVLMVAQAASVALVGLAAWLLAEHVGLGSSSRRAVLLVALIGAGAYNAALIDIHEVGLALGPLAMTVVLAMRGTTLRGYWVWPALAAAARIDLALSVLIVGILLRHERPRHARVAMSIGALAGVGMALWLLLNPWEGTSFAFHFGHLGISSASELPGAMISDPIAAIEPLLDPTMYGTLLIWLAGFMFVPPLRGVRWLLPALPTVLIAVLGSWQQADKPHLHYWHVLLPMLAIAAVFGLVKLPKLQEKAFYLAVASVAVTWVFMPLFKPPFGTDLSDERAVVSFLQEHPDASVAAYRSLIPHISHRQTVMQLPTPFACPTPPLASFIGPDGSPDLVAIPAAVMENRESSADAAVVSALQRFYEPAATFGTFEVWSRSAEVPADVYDIVCGPDAPSENS